jgi:hypothetical protein
MTPVGSSADLASMLAVSAAINGAAGQAGAPGGGPAVVPLIPPATVPASAEQAAARKEHQGRQRGAFALGAASRAWPVNIIGHPHAFCVTTTVSSKPFLCCAPSEAARADWVRVITHNVRVRQRWEQRKLMWKAAMAAAAVVSGQGGSGAGGAAPQRR